MRFFPKMALLVAVAGLLTSWVLELPPQFGPGPAEGNPAPEATPVPATESFTTQEVRSWLDAPGSAPGKYVFLTFDDGPNRSITLQVLDELRASEVHATFFVLGREVSRAPEVLRQQTAEGHAIALHSMTHDYASLYPGRSADPVRVASEFDDTLAAAQAALGDDFATTSWRYPGGHGSWQNMAAADAELAARGASWIDWNAMTGDAEPKRRRPTTVEGMVELATQPVRDGVDVAVILAHDSVGKELTVASIAPIVEAYRDAGYTFATLR